MISDGVALKCVVLLHNNAFGKNLKMIKDGVNLKMKMI
jgi:hypothetical protein